VKNKPVKKTSRKLKDFNKQFFFFSSQQYSWINSLIGEECEMWNINPKPQIWSFSNLKEKMIITGVAIWQL